MSSVTSVDNNAAIRSKNNISQQALFYCKTFIKRLVGRKPMSQLQAEIETQNELRRTLNWVQLTAIGVGAIIGAGIFVLSGQAAALYSGPSVIISFIVTGIVALLSAISFSELAAMMSVSAAAYTYTYAALGEYLAWFIGWNYTLLYQFAAFEIIADWSTYLVNFIEAISGHNVTSSVVQAPVAWNDATHSFFLTGQVINLPAIAITIAITILLVIGIRPTAIVNLVLVVLKIIILLIFIFVCCKYVNRKNYSPFFPRNQGSFGQYGVTGMLQACTYVFFAYVGFDSVATVAQEAKTPTARSIPFATIAAVIISLLIYIGICTVMIGLVSYKLLDSDDPLSVAINATPYGRWLVILMNLAGIFSLTSVILITLLSQTRIFYAMAHDGLLPPIFARVHSHTKTPWITTIISGIFCVVISGVCPVDIIGDTTSLSALITYLFVHIEVIVMRCTHRDMPREFRVPFGPWLLPTVGSLLCILLLKGVSAEAVYRFLVWTGIGQIVYFSYGFWHSKRRHSSREESVKSPRELLPTVESIVMEYMHDESESDVASEATESVAEDNLVSYF